MITEIEIENFRCFEHTKITGFARVNLIGGKNNSGKTVLLEAILLDRSPKFESIDLLRFMRNESRELQLNHPQNTWNYFFFQGNKNLVISIKSLTQTMEFRETILSEKEETRNLEDDLQNGWTYKIMRPKVEDGFIRMGDDFCSTLSITRKKELLSSEKHDSHILCLSANSRGIFFKINNNDFPDHQYIFSKSIVFSDPVGIPQNLSYFSAKRYDRASDSEQLTILSMLKIIDPSLEEIKTFDHETIDSPMLYLKRKNENYLPVALFGDAINRVIGIILNLLDNKSHFLLIDEVENGIHYTNHRDFWKALFELAKQLDIQIFATTHSLEMIQAFADVGLNQYPEEGAYFEMARSPRTGKIIAIKHELDLLHYELKSNEGVRGE